MIKFVSVQTNTNFSIKQVHAHRVCCSTLQFTDKRATSFVLGHKLLIIVTMRPVQAVECSPEAFCE